MVLQIDFVSLKCFLLKHNFDFKLNLNQINQRKTWNEKRKKYDEQTMIVH